MHVVKELCLVETNSGDMREISNHKENGGITTMAGQCVNHCDAKAGECQSYSHGYMPHHFSTRSRGWLKAIGKTSPRGDCLELPIKCSDSRLLRTGVGQDDQNKAGQSEGFSDVENIESTRGSCQMSDSHTSDTNLFGKMLLEHRVLNNTSEDLRKDIMPSSLGVSNTNRARPALTRQWSFSSLQVSGVDQEDSYNANTNSFGSDAPSQYLRFSGEPQKRGHRSMSDLGFCRTVPGSNRSNSRMLTLLQNPVFRKSLARTMRLDPEKETFDEHVFEKLSSKMEDILVPFSQHLGSSSEHSLRLCCSTSDLGLLTNFQRSFESSEDVKCRSSAENISVCNTCESGDATSTHNQLKGRKTSNEPPSSKLASKQLSAFRIPSYREFKIERRRQRFLSKSAANLASFVPTILEEDDFVGDGNKMTKEGQLVCSEEDRYINAPLSVVCKRLNHRPDQDYDHAGLQQRSVNVSAMTGGSSLNKVEQDSRLNVMTMPGSSSSSAVGKRRCSSASACMPSHQQTVEKTQENDTKHCQIFGKPKRAENQCDANYKLSFCPRRNDANIVLSDYASESNDECSDDLEDVLLMPAIDYKPPDRACPSDVNGSLNEHLSSSSLGEVFSDSGCLIERKSFDSELASDDSAPFKDYNDDGATLRSVSDVSDMFTNQLRMRSAREQRNKQSKSDPLNFKEEKDTRYRGDSRHLQSKDSKENILNFLENSIRETVSSAISVDDSLENGSRYCSKEVTASSSTLDRVDSGVGNENVDDVFKNEVSGCEDCGEMLTYSITSANMEDLVLVCDGCKQRRFQRKEAIVEIVDTEQNYGNDLNIISEHFSESMKNMGLLNAEQMKIIFINLDELINVNKYFITRLKGALDAAAEKNDELLWSVNIGQLFLDSSNMLLAYETYCINQSAAPVLLDRLLEEKDLLRIFLEVTQREKTVLRKMDLKSFLMVPVQRVMKYPLLLNRLSKVTPSSHPDCDNILEAQKKIENILELINSKTKGSSTGRLRRRTSSLHRSQDFDVTVYDKLEVHKVVMEAVDWDPSKMHFLQEGCLLCAVITDNMSLKRGRNLKYIQLHGVLISLGKNFSHDVDANARSFTQCSQVQSAALVLVKEKGNRPQLFRDPFLLHQCIVCLNEENPDVFEIHDANKDSLLLKCKQSDEMKEWFKQLQDLVCQLSRWRHRRNALANIMLHDF